MKRFILTMFLILLLPIYALADCTAVAGDATKRTREVVIRCDAEGGSVNYTLPHAGLPTLPAFAVLKYVEVIINELSEIVTFQFNTSEGSEFTSIGAYGGALDTEPGAYIEWINKSPVFIGDWTITAADLPANASIDLKLGFEQ